MPEGDVVTVGAVILAGYSTAYLVASHPHRERGEEPPVVAATLSGPGWEAAYSDTVDLGRCGVFAAWWAGPAVCLRVAMPERVREGVRYSLAGTTALGAFGGTATVPPAPTVLEPSDTVRVSVKGAKLPALVNVRFEVAEEVEAVTVDVTNAVQMRHAEGPEDDGVGAVVPEVLEIRPEAQRVRVYARWVPPEFRFELRLLGFERNYGLFVDRRREKILTPPWPSFGLSGEEGIYGYFGAGARSRAIPVVALISK